jgi:hypothetical protein
MLLFSPSTRLYLFEVINSIFRLLQRCHYLVAFDAYFEFLHLGCGSVLFGSKKW